MTATEDFSMTTNLGQRLTRDPLPDGHPTADGLVAVADRSPIFKLPGEHDLEIGDDGDDIGTTPRDQQIADMLDSGHGYLIRDIPDPTPKTYRATCKVCGGPMPTPGDDPDWLCQYYDQTRPASLDCNCAWCLRYQDYMSGKYKPRGGRPRTICASANCKRVSNQLRKRKQRGTYVVEPEPELPEDPFEEIRQTALRIKNERLAEIFARRGVTKTA